MYDIIIIGAGPAGLTAAIYARRAGKSALILEKSTFGGQITYSPNIENYPAFVSVSGNELAERMVTQALDLGAEIELTRADGIRRNSAANGFTVTSADGDFEGRAVILATGAEHRRLGIPGEDELTGRGISYCAVCDGAFYADRHVAVIGGGNSAIVEAALLAKTSKRVTVIQNLPSLTGEATAAAALLARDNVDVIYNTVIDGFIAGSDGTLQALRLKNSDGDMRTLELDGVFVAIGLVPANKPFSPAVALDDRGYIRSPENCETGTPGIYAAGDCRTKNVRQITTATADGAVAALAACAFIDAQAPAAVTV